jgi:hypothetical protein
MTVDPISFLVGVIFGVVVCRCVFLVWKEKEEAKEGIES